MMIKSAALSAFSVGLMGLSAAPYADDLNAAHVVVEGPENRVYEFHQNMKALLSAMLVNGDLGSAGVACGLGDELKSCDTLIGDDESRAPVKADYVIFRDHEQLTAFVLSWAKLQDRQFASVSITFDMKQIPGGDCLNPLQAKQPCVNAPQCAATTPRRCDKYEGQPCSSCGLP